MSSNDIVQIPVDVATRMGRATVWVEQHSRGGVKPGHSQACGPVGLWATITGGNNGQYSWTALVPQNNNNLSQNSTYGSGNYNDSSGYAVEASGSTAVPSNSTVWLVPSVCQPYYVFGYGNALRICMGSSGSIDSGNNTISVSGITVLFGLAFTESNPTFTVANYLNYNPANGSTIIFLVNTYTASTATGTGTLLTVSLSTNTVTNPTQVLVKGDNNQIGWYTIGSCASS
jgi:hypothetical protein